MSVASPVTVTFDPSVILTSAERETASRAVLASTGRFAADQVPQVARDLQAPRGTGAFQRGLRALRSRGLITGVGAHRAAPASPEVAVGTASNREV